MRSRTNMGYGHRYNRDDRFLVRRFLAPAILGLVLLITQPAGATSLTVTMFNGCQDCNLSGSFQSGDKTGLQKFNDDFLHSSLLAIPGVTSITTHVFTPFSGLLDFSFGPNFQAGIAHTFATQNQGNVNVLIGHSLGGGDFLSSFAGSLPFQVDLSMRLDGQCWGLAFLSCHQTLPFNNNKQVIGITGAKFTHNWYQTNTFPGGFDVLGENDQLFSTDPVTGSPIAHDSIDDNRTIHFTMYGLIAATVAAVVPVPEPSTWVLMVTGLALVFLRKRW